MANVNSPFGFRWHGLSGDAVTPSSGLIVAKIATAPGHTFGEGDPLMRLSTGYVDALTRTTAGSYFVGIFKACEYYDTSQGRKVWRNYYPNSASTGDVTVYMEPALGAVTPRFIVQSSGAGAITFGNVGMNIDIAVGTSTAGTVTSGYYRSACTTDLLANVTTTTTVPFRIVGLFSDIAAPGSPGADTASAYNWVIVEANNSGNQGI
jgi:hypothetical protein